jgi:hypothetical protein
MQDHGHWCMYLLVGSCFATHITLLFLVDIEIVGTAMKYQRQGAGSMLIHMAASKWMTKALKPFSRHLSKPHGYSYDPVSAVSQKHTRGLKSDTCLKES